MFKPGDLVKFNPKTFWVTDKTVNAWFDNPGKSANTYVLRNDVFEVISYINYVIEVWNPAQKLIGYFSARDFIPYNV